jgi:hypothetical protein
MPWTLSISSVLIRPNRIRTSSRFGMISAQTRSAFFAMEKRLPLFRIMLGLLT